MPAGVYITITGLPAHALTDRFFVDPTDGWSAAQFLADVCDWLGCSGCTHELRKDGVALDDGFSIDAQVEAGDVLALVEV
jgi:hypothetical protein